MLLYLSYMLVIITYINSLSIAEGDNFNKTPNILTAVIWTVDFGNWLKLTSSHRINKYRRIRYWPLAPHPNIFFNLILSMYHGPLLPGHDFPVHAALVFANHNVVNITGRALLKPIGYKMEIQGVRSCNAFIRASVCSGLPALMRILFCSSGLSK
jgi:hypothetical protein